MYQFHNLHDASDVIKLLTVGPAFKQDYQPFYISQVTITILPFGKWNNYIRLKLMENYPSLSFLQES